MHAKRLEALELSSLEEVSEENLIQSLKESRAHSMVGFSSSVLKNEEEPI